MPVQQLESAAAWDELINGDKVVVVDFTASWCGPCRVIGPIFEKLADEEENAVPSVVYLKVDVDAHENVAGACGISAMPTFQVWHKGTKVKEIIGADKAKLTTLIKEAIALTTAPVPAA